ncbi:hypothetical protein VPH35_022069 [Triticum aestivum]
MTQRRGVMLLLEISPAGSAAKPPLTPDPHRPRRESAGSSTSRSAPSMDLASPASHPAAMGAAAPPSGLERFLQSMAAGDGPPQAAQDPGASMFHMRAPHLPVSHAPPRLEPPSPNRISSSAPDPVGSTYSTVAAFSVPLPPVETPDLRANAMSHAVPELNRHGFVYDLYIHVCIYV